MASDQKVMYGEVIHNDEKKKFGYPPFIFFQPQGGRVFSCPHLTLFRPESQKLFFCIPKSFGVDIYFWPNLTVIPIKCNPPLWGQKLQNRFSPFWSRNFSYKCMTDYTLFYVRNPLDSFIIPSKSPLRGPPYKI